MAQAATVAHLRQEGELPYIGLRPFERHESNRLFGRNRDAQIVCDRTLSGRVTILYAQSGLGKSSLLRALVIPRLEGNSARVVYFDSWAQEDPLRALKDTLIGMAAALNVPDPGRASPTLLELVRLLNNVDDQSVVLILDQFEEFLVHHGHALDPLRSELAALVRAPGLDASVVVALREEFLAAMEPFRQQILNLFQSAYRLEALSEADLRDAICRPAEEFGGSCEQPMADQLIRDLREGPAEAAAGAFPRVELPMLQLVCRELWMHAAEGKLSLDLYARMGGVRRILDTYVRNLMPKSTREQSLTARLLVHLAPPSGLKMSYAVEDLSSMTGLASAVIAAELVRLSRARILRTRQHRGGERFELEHDAFIPVLSSWRDQVLDRAQRRRTMRRAVYGAAALAVVISAVATSLVTQAGAVRRAALMRAVLAANDPLVSALALPELADAGVPELSFAEVHQLAIAAIPAALLRDQNPQAAGGPVVRGWFMPGDKRIGTVSENGRLKFWNFDGRGNPVALDLAIGSRISAAAVSSDGQWIAVGLDTGEVRLGRSDGSAFTRVAPSVKGASGYIKLTALALASNGERLLAAYDDYTVRLWNRDGRPAAVLGDQNSRHTGEILGLEFDAQGKRALTASLDGAAKIWAIDRPRAPLAVLGSDSQRGAGGAVRPMTSGAFSPDGNWVACGFQDGGAAIWRSDGHGAAVQLKDPKYTGDHEGPVSAIAFNRDGLKVITGSRDRSAKVWDLRLDKDELAGGAIRTTLAPVGFPMVLRGHAGAIRAVGFNSDGSRILTASDDQTARIWLNEPKEPRVLGKHGRNVERISFSRDGKRVASASRDGTIRIWSLDGSPDPPPLEGHTDWVRSAEFSPDGNTLVSASEDGTARLWELATRRVRIRQVFGLSSVSFSPDGAAIITGSREPGDGAVNVWSDDPTQDQPLVTIKEEKSWVFFAGFSPDGSHIVTASADGKARIWRHTPGKWAIADSPVVLPHQDRVFGAAFSPDGRKVATSSADHQARVWNLDGSMAWSFSHSNEVWQIGFNFDGQQLVTASLDGAARIWDVEHGVLRLMLSHPAGLRAAAFRPGGREVVTGSEDGRVRLWRTDVPDLIEYLRRTSTACLTPPERVQFLGETDRKAKSAYNACEAHHGRGGSTN
jgi:WD40 repeat protein